MNTLPLQKTTFALQFGGFYNSHHEFVVDDKVELYYPELDVDDINWQMTHENYAKAWLDMFESHLEHEHDLTIDLEFSSLWSPKYYNFQTDEIMTAIPTEQYKKLKVIFNNDPEFVEWVNTASRSRDGFVSFYSGIDEVSANDEIFLQYLFMFLVNETRENMYYMDIDFDIEIN